MKKLDKLIKSAKESAEFRNHKLFRFTHYKDVKYLAQSRCKSCGMYVGINAKPLPNEIEIFGEAVAFHCKKNT